MRKILIRSFLTAALIVSPLYKIQQAEAASSVEYSLLVALIAKIAAGVSGSGSALDMSKVQYCTTAANTCSMSETTLSTLKLNLQTFQAGAYKCFYEQTFKLKRYPTSDELNTLCGQEMSLLSKHQTLISSAITVKDQSCQLKDLACKEFPSVLNPIQQQFQQIGQQL